ncbi:MAG: tRNA (adenosine(37)-N6)-dimethylallyltransferase MiaA [Candidatus Omnitrophota bacterium]
MNKVIFIVGPTSSGKSVVAARLAEILNGEIISSDSMQIYQGMDIITQAPGEDLLSRARHHLVKVLSPEEEFNAARFAEEAERVIVSISGSGKTPIVAGGTGLYIKALVDGIFSAPPKDEDLRRRLQELANEKGNEYLYAQLKGIDPETAVKLHHNDIRRIIRALEVYELTGSTIDDKKTDSSGISEKYNCNFFGLKLPRKVLYERINSNVERMFEGGLVEEVKRLNELKLSLTAEKALGIKEVTLLLDEKCDIEQAKEELKKNTRHYAKRQLTWFRSDKRIKWIDADRDVEEIVQDIADSVTKNDS